MKIIVLGAGRVGATLAEHLTLDHNDITLVDTNADKLQLIQERNDVKTVVGHAGFPNILEQAGIEDADLLIAVTNCDEINMVACQLASKLFHTPSKIARIRAPEYTENESPLFSQELIDINHVISPELLVSKAIQQSIRLPGSLQVLNFCDGRVKLVVVRAEEGAQLCGIPLKDIGHYIPESAPKIIALYRDGMALPLHDEQCLQPNDEVFFLSPSFLCRDMIALLQVEPSPYQRIIIAGGGHIGANLANSLERDYLVKIIELDPERVNLIANSLQKTLVLHGNTCDKLLLLDENIEDTDVFCAVTNDDEANIMASLLAKKLGVRKVMTLINQSSYVELIEGGVIDVVISPKQTTVSGFLRHTRRGDIVQVHTLRRGAAEAIEIIAHGTQKTSKVVGRLIRQVSLPKEVLIGAIVRENKVLMAHDELEIQENDHVILFLREAKQIRAVERLFQVELGFF